MVAVDRAIRRPMQRAPTSRNDPMSLPGCRNCWLSTGRHRCPACGGGPLCRFCLQPRAHGCIPEDGSRRRQGNYSVRCDGPAVLPAACKKTCDVVLDDGPCRIDCVGVKNHEGPHRCGLHFGVPRVSRGQEYAARSSAGSSNDHLQAGRAPARAGAAAESVFAAAPLVSAAEIARVSSWRRCECCGWTVLPEHITGVCAVCCRSVVCRRCERDWRRVCDEPNWPAVCYTCGGTLAKGQPLHYTC